MIKHILYTQVNQCLRQAGTTKWVSLILFSVALWDLPISHIGHTQRGLNSNSMCHLISSFNYWGWNLKVYFPLKTLITKIQDGWLPYQCPWRTPSSITLNNPQLKHSMSCIIQLTITVAHVGPYTLIKWIKLQDSENSSKQSKLGLHHGIDW